MNAGHSMSEWMGEQSGSESHDQYARGVTAGALLREAREAAGVHIAALAGATKVPVGKLEALEADDFSALPDIVFVRALASSICRTLKIHPEPVLALLPQGESPRLSTNDGGLNATVKGFRSKSSSTPFVVPRSKTLVWVVGMLLIGAALMIFLPRSLEADLLALFKQRAPDAVISTPAVDVAQERPAPAISAPASATSGVEVAALTGDSKESAGEVPPVPAMSSVGASAVPPSAVDAPAGVLAFKARSESWVQVRDATGAVVFRRNLAPDELVSVSGALPLAVVVGRADATEVFVRGKPYELGSVSRENVARFEVR